MLLKSRALNLYMHWHSTGKILQEFFIREKIGNVILIM